MIAVRSQRSMYGKARPAVPVDDHVSAVFSVFDDVWTGPDGVFVLARVLGKFDTVSVVVWRFELVLEELVS